MRYILSTGPNIIIKGPLMLKPHKKIAIIGCAGSGKTTLALRLHKQLNLPLYHLDQYYWLPGWERTDFDMFIQMHDELCDRNEWIIEGSYIRVLTPRLMQADVIIFLDMPRYVCMWRVLKRSFLNWGKVIPGNPEGCRQQIFTRKFLDFLQWTWNFNQRFRPVICKLLEEFKDEKPVYVVRSAQDLNNFSM